MPKKDDILFSIIVPVYNVEKYIIKCLNSIIKAIDIDCEVIIINDGSEDNCELIIKNYLDKLPQKTKKQFKYIYKENKGLADTKNLGLKLARGKYISVIDSDDQIADDFYITARRYINDGYDVIIYDLYLNFEDNNKLNCIARAIREDVGGTFINQIMMGAMLGSSCNKIIKRTLYKYEFPSGKQYEDVCVTPFILIDAQKIKYIPHANYIYLQRQKSIVASNSLDGAFFKICNNISNVFKSIDNYDIYREIIFVFFIDRTIDMLDMHLKKSRRKFLYSLKNYYYENMEIINYIYENNLINEKQEQLTRNQYKILKYIYNSLYVKKFKNVKTILIIRRIINWIRNIIISIVKVFKIIFGGIYG